MKLAWNKSKFIDVKKVIKKKTSHKYSVKMDGKNHAERGSIVIEYQNELKNIIFQLMDSLRGEWEKKEEEKRTQVIASINAMKKCNRVQPELAKAVRKWEKEYECLSQKQKRICCPENLEKNLKIIKTELSQANDKYEENVDLYYKNKTLFEQLHEQRIGLQCYFYSEVERAHATLLSDIHAFRDGFNLLEGEMEGEDLRSISDLEQDIQKKKDSLRIKLREFEEVEDISDFDTNDAEMLRDIDAQLNVEMAAKKAAERAAEKYHVRDKAADDGIPYS